MAEFTIVTRSSSSAWIVLPTLGLAGSFLNGPAHGLDLLILCVLQIV